MYREFILFELSEGIATITINRPSSMNAMTRSVLLELEDAVSEVARRTEIRTAIITGAGNKAFMAGADISAMKDMDSLQGRELSLLAHRIYSAIERSPKPYIAAVNGYALGGGCELALACDIRIASDNARFGQPEINIGILPGFGGSQRLPRLIGKGLALEMILTGEMIDANEAYRTGLANKVVHQDKLLEESRRIAARITSKSAIALRLCKEAVNNGLEMDLNRACEYEAELFALSFATADQKEGMAAFLDKRPAKFIDR